MKSQVLGLRVAGTVFGFMSLAQLARLIMRAELMVQAICYRCGQARLPSWSWVVWASGCGSSPVRKRKGSALN